MRAKASSILLFMVLMMTQSISIANAGENQRSSFEQDIIGPICVILLIGYVVIKIMKKMQSPLLSFISPSGAGLALLCFFLPWMEVSCVGQTKSISGADIGGEFWVVFIAAMIVLGTYLYFSNIKMLSKAKPIIIVSSLVGIGFLAFKFWKVNSGIDTGFGKMTLSDIGFKLQLGGFGTIIGFIMALVGGMDLSDADALVPTKYALPGNVSLEKIKEAKQLLDNGSISEDEYNKIKDKILN